MQPSRTRLLCRAHNRFTPSIALWQHFVVPNRPFLHQQHLSSAATEAAQDGANTNDSNLSPPEASKLDQVEAAITGNETQLEKPQMNIRRMTTTKGLWHGNKVNASSAKNLQVQYNSRQSSLTEPEKLLAIARAAFETAEDYEGVAVKPMVNATPVKESSLPWCLKPEERTMAGMDRLVLEIDSFHEFVRPDRFESIARKHLIEQVRNHTRKALPEHVLEVFGSERTGIALATSDIDFRLMRHSQLSDPAATKLPPTGAERSQAMKDLKRLYWHTLKGHKAYLVSMLRHARYPLISLQDRQSGLDVQIVLSNDTSVSRVIMQGYMEEYPYLRQLYSVIKTVFDVRGLSDVFRGGFGSYSLFMMTVASIRHNPHPRQDAAGGLVNFLKFWRDFDTKTQGVSIEPVFLFDKTSHPIMTDTVKAKLDGGITKPLPAYMLSLRDPADETNDLGRKGIAVRHVQATFKKLYEGLAWDMKANTRPSILGPLVGPSYMLDYARRRRLRDYGKRVMIQMKTSLAVKAKAIRDTEGTGAADPEAKEEAYKQANADAERQAEEYEKQQQLAREERDREWRRLANERNEMLRSEAERTSVLEHGESVASIGEMPSVGEVPNTKGTTKTEQTQRAEANDQSKSTQ